MTQFVQREVPEVIAQSLVNDGYHPALARVLASRGIRTPEDLSADWRGMLPPNTLLGTDAAAKLLADAIEQNKRIMIVADYDCDGATACAVAVRGLRSMGATVDYIVPDRFVYGYGLTPATWIAPPKSRSFSVSVVLPASGCAITANVRRLVISSISAICLLLL